MARQRIDVRLPPELIARVRDQPGSFTSFVERALEQALGDGHLPRVVGVSEPPQRSEDVRASESPSARPAPVRAPVHDWAAERQAKLNKAKGL